MGTNYYLYTSVCLQCGRGDEPLHIGKSSGGWCFSLHVDPDKGINDLPDLESRWSTPDAVIRDEYGRAVTPEEIRAVITERKWSRTDMPLPESWYRDNHAVPGPYNLARHKIEPGHCIAHGAGTWDCIVGEFS